MSNLYSINADSFSSGQIGSKLWLCEELEKLNWKSSLTWIYGGWYAITALLLLSRRNFEVSKIVSFDIDPECEPIADMINENWVWQEWKFKAQTADCSTLIPSKADLIINTSTEHFDSMDWFNNIPKGTRVILQGNNMSHDDHVVHSDTIDSFVKQYPLDNYSFIGTKEFVYPTWSFSRFMVIGIK
jgi:hypothetical protein